MCEGENGKIAGSCGSAAVISPRQSGLAQFMPENNAAALPRALTNARAAFRLSRVFLHVLYGATTVAAIYPLSSVAVRQRLKQRWSRQLLGMLGVSVPAAASATPLPDGLLVSNHISWLDIFVINAVVPSAFVSKDDVKSWPILGWMSQRADTIFIERGNRRAAHRTSEHLNDCLRRGQRVAIFPEGTTSDGHGVLPFHGALLQAAVESECRVQPLALSYRDRDGHISQAPTYIGDTSLLQSLHAIASASGLRADPRFLAPVSAAGMDRRHLAATLHRHISHALAGHAPAR